MPKPQNTALRVLIPIVLVLAGIGVAAAVLVNSGQRPNASKPATSTDPAAQPPATQTGTTPPAAATAPPSGTPIADGNQPASTPGIAQPPVGENADVLKGLRAETIDAGKTAAFAPLGSLAADDGYAAKVEFTALGAGIRSITLARHFETVRREINTIVQREHVVKDTQGIPAVVAPLAALGLSINGVEVPLVGAYDEPANAATGTSAGLFGKPVWREIAPGTFEAHIVNERGERIIRLQRRYELPKGSYVVRIAQTATNLTTIPLRIAWQQYGPVDLVQDAAGYGGDKRRILFGHLLKPGSQGNDPTVTTNRFLTSRDEILGSPGVNGYEVTPVWPNRTSAASEYRLVWVGMTNRYFGAALQPLVQPGTGPDQKLLPLIVDRVVLPGGPEPVIALRTTSSAREIKAGDSVEQSLGLYAGPLSRKEIKKEAANEAVGLRGLVVYNFGGPCGWCTFPLLTGLLLGLLNSLHDYLLFDWALSISALVLIVRSVLHPVTRWSQIRMQRFGKQMQEMAPKQKKLQEKYASDPKQMREEMAKLWREEGISPTGALGCIPMFLQTPVWIALYAVLYFAVELRHEPAFFGLFQAIAPGFPKFMGWFLADLAEPDRFFYFGRDLFSIPMLGPINSINILPFVLGIVFFVQQKYLTPPPTTALSPEQEMQQKMMKWMMVILFPALMYNAPSGLAVYFIVNSTLGILESKWIRAHINKHDLLKPRPKKPGGGGFIQRMQQLAEARQKQLMKVKGMPPPARRKV
ncbi:MAG: membrane protein insertase YidC [Phycisphaerales bacterium]